MSQELREATQCLLQLLDDYHRRAHLHDPACAWVLAFGLGICSCGVQDCLNKIQYELAIAPEDKDDCLDELRTAIQKADHLTYELEQAQKYMDEIRAQAASTVEKANERIAELVVQADATYAPYREEIMKARAEADSLGTRLYKAKEALKQIRELANYDIDHEEDGNTYQIEAIARAALEDA